MDDTGYRLTDAELQRFLIDGYLTVRPELPAAFHRRAYDRIGTVLERTGNPRNNILPQVPELQRVFGHPRVTAALASILGDGYYLHMHRHCHDRSPEPSRRGCTRTAFTTAASPWTAIAATITRAGRWRSTTRRTPTRRWARPRSCRAATT